MYGALVIYYKERKENYGHPTLQVMGALAQRSYHLLLNTLPNASERTPACMPAGQTVTLPPPSIGRAPRDVLPLGLFGYI